jgi:hypothetical protein
MLPKDYTHNHALLPLEQRQAMAEDLRRWKLAIEMFAPRKAANGLAAINAANTKIKLGLEAIPAGGYREDMRRRLNILKGKLK